MSEGGPMEARAILEIAKATGRVEIFPYFTLFTREFLSHPGRVISIDPIHQIRVDKPFSSDPFIFVLSDVTTGKFNVGMSDTEGNALKMIELILTLKETKDLGYLKDCLLNIPEYIPETQEALKG